MTALRHAHLDLLCRDGRTALQDPDGPLRYAARRALGPVSFDGLVVGDLLTASFGPLTWTGPGSMPSSGTAFVLTVLWDVGHERTGALGIRFSEEPVVRWVNAEVACGVDTGTVGFASADLADLIYESEDIFAEVDARDPWNGLLLDRGGKSVAISSSGWGDGFYDTFWGLDANGAPAWVAVDFDVLSMGVFDEVVIPLPLSRGRTELFDGVTMKVGLFTKKKPTITPKLPTGQYVYTRVRTPDGLKAPKVTWGSDLGRSMTLDLAPHPDADAFIARRVTHHAPMPIVPEPSEG